MSEGYVLVADDDPDVQQLVNDILESMDIVSKQAMDGKTALEMVHEEIPAAIVLDLMMPGIDGYEILDELEKDENLSSIPVLVMSAYIDRHEYALRDRPSVFGVLTKGGTSTMRLKELLLAALGRPM